MRFTSPPLPKEDLVQPWRYLCAEFGAKVLKVVGGEIEETDATFYLFNDIFVIAKPEDSSSSSSSSSSSGSSSSSSSSGGGGGAANGKLMVLAGQKLWNCFLKKLEVSWKLSQLALPPFQVVNPNGVWNLIIDNKQKFKQDFEANRDAVLANSSERRQKRGLIKLFANDETQEWMAVEPAPTYASNRVSTQILAAETTEFTKMALEELLSENREIFESRTFTPAKTPKKSRLGKLMDAMTPLKWSSKKAPPAASTSASNINLPAAGSTAVSSTSAMSGSLNASSTMNLNMVSSTITTTMTTNTTTTAAASSVAGGVPTVLTFASFSSPTIRPLQSSASAPNQDLHYHHHNNNSSNSNSNSQQHSTPSRKSASIASAASESFSSPCHTPGHGTMPSMTVVVATADKENGADACNQADVIRSTIAKLSQSSAALQQHHNIHHHHHGKQTLSSSTGAASIQSSSTPNLSSSTKKKMVFDSPTAATTTSPMATMEAKRRRHRKASTSTEPPHIPNAMTQY